MTPEPEVQRLFQKMLHVRETLDAIDGWSESRELADPEASEVDIGSLLQGLLASRTVTLDNLDSYLEDETR